MFGTKSKSAQVLAGIFLLIMAYLPVHALLSTWAISNFGYETLFKAWKELLLLFVAMPLAIWVVYKDKKVYKTISQSRINWLIAGFVAINILLVLIRDNPVKAEIAGLVFNLRFFAMFLVAQVLAIKLVKSSFQEVVLNIIFWGGVFVVIFGALQVLLLPNDFLRHFGYQQDIIPPYFTVDNNENIIRILSTLRGPNALGAYLVFWLPILAMVTKRIFTNNGLKKNHAVLTAVILWVCGLITLFGSRSRSALLGAIISLGVFVLLSANNAWRRRLLVLGLVVAIAVGVVLSINWNSSFVQTTLKHRDPSESSNIDSDDQRASSLTGSVRAILANPVGSGPGSVNLASTYGNKPNIVENYYLQIGQELGVLGLLIFMAILVLVVLQLWRVRANSIVADALLAGFVGLCFVNMLLPGWSDETVSMLWWGLAGVIIFGYSVKNIRSQNASR